MDIYLNIIVRVIFFCKFSPTAKSAIILDHHIVTKNVWKWYIKEDDLEHCNADDHARKVCEQIKAALGIYGFRTAIVPYPKKSGLQLRSIAQAAGAGEIGINVFLLNPLVGSLDTSAHSRNRHIFSRQPDNSRTCLQPVW